LVGTVKANIDYFGIDCSIFSEGVMYDKETEDFNFVNKKFKDQNIKVIYKTLINSTQLTTLIRKAVR
jgi:hypothetical protein